MKNKIFTVIIFVFFFHNSFSQNFNKIFWSLDFKDKVWILSNPNSSLKVKKVSKQVSSFSNKQLNISYLNSNFSEGEQDAFRHIYLMYKLSSKIGVEKARRFGNIYESYNKKVFYKKRNSGYDRAGEWMDKFNNEVGIFVFLKIGNTNDEHLIQEIGYQIKEGNARKIKKDLKGNSLNTDNMIINKEIWMKNWVNERVLIQTNN
ncbi:MAG: hypothetical protein PHN41_00125 [Bacteroidales bacterium]|nr:hypothetical protein [Bacteroidales bacterium]MDD4703181.1 hypothetical protein [Bacteroidales bacterium]MDX9797828.1 hypothetical protein [Bacteroidales bacterium]